MLRLAVDFGDGKKGDAIRKWGSNICTAEFIDVVVGRITDLETLIQHGIIVEVEEPRWTDYDMIAVIAVTMQNTVRMTPSQLFENFKKTKGIK